MAVAAASGETSAAIGATPWLNAGHWLDSQWYSVATNYRYEGNLDATVITNASLRFDCWATNYVAGVQLYLPFFCAIAIIPWYDLTAVGDPDYWAPTVLPNLFVRDWGHLQVTGPAGDPPAPFIAQQPRVVHRAFALIDATDLAFGQAGRLWTHSFKLRNILVPKTHTAFLLMGAYNTHATTAVTLGIRLSGTFGYRHLTRS